jgi:hypothetical protein
MSSIKIDKMELDELVKKLRAEYSARPPYPNHYNMSRLKKPMSAWLAKLHLSYDIKIYDINNPWVSGKLPNNDSVFRFFVSVEKNILNEMRQTNIAELLDLYFKKSIDNFYNELAISAICSFSHSVAASAGNTRPQLIEAMRKTCKEALLRFECLFRIYVKQHDTHWYNYNVRMFFDDISLCQILESFDYLREAVSNGLGWFWVNKGALELFVCPHMKIDSKGKLHSDDSPAVMHPISRCAKKSIYVRERKIYWIHGVRVNRKIVEKPRTLTYKDLFRTWNVEVRRIMFERRFPDGLSKMKGIKIVEEEKSINQHNILFDLRLKQKVRARVLQVTCPSTSRKYLLTVPPRIKSLRRAIAWTFGLHEKQYRPLLES